MFRRLMGITLAASVLLAAMSAQADDATQLLTQYKNASGGARWDAVKTLHATGALSAGGLDGEFTMIQDLASGRSASQYKLGPLEGADGYDGQHGWTRRNRQQAIRSCCGSIPTAECSRASCSAKGRTL